MNSNPEPGKSIKVFVSYTHDSQDHSNRVLSLSNYLRQQGFDCDIDQYHANESWPLWMERRIAWADYVLVVCTPTYLRRWNNDEKPGMGLGAQWESLLTRQHLYSSPGTNHKFIPIIFQSQHVQCRPIPLADVTYIDLSRPNGAHLLCCRLLNIAPAQKPPVRTSLAPYTLAEGFFTEHGSHAHVEQTIFDNQLVGLENTLEPLFPNLFPVSYPSGLQRGRIFLKRGIKPSEHFAYIWKDRGMNGAPPVDYHIENRILYTFHAWDNPFLKALTEVNVVRPVVPMPTSDWAKSKVMADKNNFIKLLNRCLDQLCFCHDMAHKIAWSKEMRCHLFVATNDTKIGRIKVKAIEQEGKRILYKAIPDGTSSAPNSIQHWQHQAFRHSFVRFGEQWFLSLTPFWAFTSDGQVTPSRWQKTSSRNMRKPERNRAVLGHVMFWASILCREPDLIRPVAPFRLYKPRPLEVTPSVQDETWMKIAKSEEKKELQNDLNLDVLL